MGFDILRRLVAEQALDSFHQQSITLSSVERRVDPCAYGIKLFLAPEGFNRGPIVQPVFVKLE